MRVRCDWQLFAFSESVFIRRKWWRIYACTIHQVNISKSMLDSFSFVVSKLNFPLDSDKIHFFPFLCSSRLVPIRDKSSWISWRFLSTLRTKYFCRSFDNRERISCYYYYPSLSGFMSWKKFQFEVNKRNVCVWK